MSGLAAAGVITLAGLALNAAGGQKSYNDARNLVDPSYTGEIVSNVGFVTIVVGIAMAISATTTVVARASSAS